MAALPRRLVFSLVLLSGSAAWASDVFVPKVPADAVRLGSAPSAGAAPALTWCVSYQGAPAMRDRVLQRVQEALQQRGISTGTQGCTHSAVATVEAVDAGTAVIVGIRSYSTKVVITVDDDHDQRVASGAGSGAIPCSVPDLTPVSCSNRLLPLVDRAVSDLLATSRLLSGSPQAPRPSVSVTVTPGKDVSPQFPPALMAMLREDLGARRVEVLDAPRPGANEVRLNLDVQDRGSSLIPGLHSYDVTLAGTNGTRELKFRAAIPCISPNLAPTSCTSLVRQRLVELAANAIAEGLRTTGSHAEPRRNRMWLADRGSIEWAGQAGDLALMEELLASDPQILKQHPTALLRAVDANQLQAAELLMQRGATAPAGSGTEGAAHYAAALAGADMLRLLARYGAPMDEPNADGARPLHVAAAEGRLENVKFLVEKGVGVDARDRKGATPLWHAARAGAWPVVEFLLTRPEVTSDVRPVREESSLQMAARKAPDALAAAMHARALERKSQLARRFSLPALRAYESERAAFHEAVNRADPGTVVPLLKKWPEFSRDFQGGDEPLVRVFNARVNGRPDMLTEVLTALLDAGARPGGEPEGGTPRTPLAMAAQAHSLAGVELLLKRRADPWDERSRSALCRTAGSSHPTVMAGLQRLLPSGLCAAR